MIGFSGRFTSLLVVLGVLALSARAIAQNGGLTDRPAWSTENVHHRTTDVSLADVDGDGDLDLVCGNDGAANTAWFNDNGVFGSVPAWSSIPANPTRAVALGDIDGDGRLDLVCANWGKELAIYRNLGTTFDTSPVYAGGLEYARAVALADMDGDGDLDLVCGSGSFPPGEPDHVYKNDGTGTFAVSPMWTSTESHLTTAVAVGDLDNNGYIDLVCAVGFTGAYRNVAYYNYGGTLDTIPSWRSADASNTRDVVLGDIDGNGYLDVLCANYASVNTLYLNDGFSVDTVSSWSLTDSWLSQCVAIGDVDGDGDLDVAVGNGSAPQDDLVFLNSSGALSTTPAWSSWRPPGGGDATTSVALGDVDGDGDLDLVTGNYDESDKLYRNESSYFAGTPDWSGPGTDTDTWAVALGDVDGDGDLDLVEGNVNSGQKNRLFLFDDGAYHQTGWTPVPIEQTSDVLLVDLDNNGELDLVTVGNTVLTADSTTSCYIYPNDGTGFPDDPMVYEGSWGPLVSHIGGIEVASGHVDDDPLVDVVIYVGLYLNNGTGGFLPDPPAWAPSEQTFARGILLFDANDDGHPEVIRGNFDGGIEIFLGDPATHFRYHPWVSITEAPGAESLNHMAAGDIDGDGFTDIVCAGNESNFVQFGNGSSFYIDPALFGYNPREPSASVALGDLDADGNLDAVCANSGIGNSIYLGGAAVFADTASWRWPAGAAGKDVAVGDVDRDGDLDVVFANDGQSNTLFLGRRGPAFRGDPLSPANHRANNAAHLRTVEASPTGPNQHTVAFTVVDVESDSVRLVVEYSFRGSGTWAPAEGDGNIGRFGPFASSPEGIRHTIAWDVAGLPWSRQESVLRFRVLETPRTVSEFQYAPSYLYTYQRIVPDRQEISIPVDTLSYGTLTLGDTLSLSFPVYNTGTVMLAVHDIDLPSNEMRVDGVTSFTVPPRHADTVRVMLEPRTQLDIAGAISVYSDDPNTPVKEVQVTTNILPLEVNTTVAVADPQVPPGQAVTVEVAPLEDVHVQTADLFHRPSGAADFSDSLACGWSIDRFYVTIWGDYVTEVGVDFYIRLRNGGVQATDPVDAPNDWYHIAVEPPTELTTTPRGDASGRYTEGTPIVVDVEPQRGTVFVDGALHFREGGTTKFQSALVDETEGGLTAFVPDSVVTARGVEYWVELHTATDTLTDPAVNPAQLPRSVPVTVLDLQEPKGHPGMRYRLLSVPITMEGSILGALTDNLGPLDNTKWRLFRCDDCATSDYIELTSQNVFDFELGRAYWLISKDGHRVDTGPARGVTTPTNRPHEITLQPGGIFLANPFGFPIAWSSIAVTVDTLLSYVDPPRRYDGGNWPDVEILEPFDGYWVKNTHTLAPVTLLIPPIEAVPTPMVATNVESDWRIKITATCGNARDAYTRLGVDATSNSGWDNLDRSEPPMPPGEAVAVYFPHGGWRNRAGPYGVDVRSRSAEGHVWRFDVAKNFTREAGGDEVVFEFHGVESLETSSECVLVDRELEREVDLKEEPQYAFYLAIRDFEAKASDTRFALIVGSEEYTEARRSELITTPSQTTLYQNFPNPFNPSTVIRYDVAVASEVELVIYNARGAMVKVLERKHRRPGRYEVGWDGENQRGQRVASGVYFYRLVAGTFTQTRKMVLLK